jgi:hypothetical protein
MLLSGEKTYEAQIQFIETQFKSLNENPKKTLYVHRTCATDTKQVESVIASVLDTIMSKSLKDSGVQ